MTNNRNITYLYGTTWVSYPSSLAMLVDYLYLEPLIYNECLSDPLNSLPCRNFRSAKLQKQHCRDQIKPDSYLPEYEGKINA